MAGVGMYWTLAELCGEKLKKDPEEEFTRAHCDFDFECGYLCRELGTNRRGIGHVLGVFAEHSLISADCFEDVIRIKMPKLLECLDRDSKRARIPRVDGAPKKKIENKNKSGAIFFNWPTAATKVYVALKKYPRWGDSEAEVRADLGDSLFELARNDAHRMRILKDDEWTVRTIAGWLKDASQRRQLTFIDCQKNILELSK